LTEPTVNKPKRTRLRTVLGPPRPTMVKGQSSPAKLHGMLAVRPFPKPSPMVEQTEVIIEDDVTMYDILEPVTPHVRSVKRPTSGSVTPHQKAIFDNLLGNSSASNTPSIPSISGLQLTDRKPRSLLTGLSRSSSDIPQTNHSRKPRLVDTLIQAVSSPEEENSESGEETEDDITKFSAASGPTIYMGRRKRKISISGVYEKDAGVQNPARSQALQATLLLNNNTKITYAKQRSYVEDNNLEDKLFSSMDFDDVPGLNGFGSSNKPSSRSEDEDDPTSQVRGIHELRKQGQSHKFQLEAQSAIDDISGKGGLGNSVRRSAMVDFCTKLVDEDYVEQLLESFLGHQFLSCLKSKGEIIFDFAATAAIAFILKTEPGYTILDQIQRSDIMETLTRLLDSATDVLRIAKDRKTNLSRIGQESVAQLRALVQDSSIWASENPDKVTPQILSMKVLELLVLALRKAGSTEALLHEDVISRLLDISSDPCNRLKLGKESPQDLITLSATFSIMEAVSISKERQATWSNDVVRRLVDMMPVLFDASVASPIKLAIRLCMNLTNNKPKACDAFAAPSFVKPLVRSICHRFTVLSGQIDDEQRSELLEGLILSLGAMINLAEFSDQSRASVVDGDDELVDALSNIFLEGSERAAQVRFCLHLCGKVYH